MSTYAEFTKEKEVLRQRIDVIIGLIPNDFSKKDFVVRALKQRQDSIGFSSPEAMSARWQEVAKILSKNLPQTSKVKWSREIAELFSASF